MKRILVFIGLKIIELGPCFLIGYLMGKALIFAVTSTLSESFAHILLLIIVSLFMVFLIWTIYMSIKEKCWQKFIKENWEWAGNILK